MNAAQRKHQDGLRASDRAAVLRDREWGNGIAGHHAQEAWVREIEQAEMNRAPMEIPLGNVERVVRAVRAYRSSGGMQEAELKKIDDAVIEFGRYGEIKKTIAEIYAEYRGAEWTDEATTLTDLPQAKKSDLIIEILQAQMDQQKVIHDAG